MVFKHDGQTWTVSPTNRDHNSVFHAIFGVRKIDEDLHIEDIAHVRRMNFLLFLTFYEDRQIPAALQEALRPLFQKHGWSIEHKNDFREYIKFAGEERQILPEELALLAALENVKIVVFENEHELPRIVEPTPAILEDYPFISNNSIEETAVVALIDNTYSKLTPQNTREDVGRYHKPSGAKYKKIAMAPLAGIWYEISLLTVVLLNALRNGNTWRLSTEDADAACFDDVVLEVGPEHSAFLLQVKHQHRKRTVALADCFDRRSSGFYLAKYFFSYIKVRDNYNISKLVLCTNTTIRLDGIEDCIATRNLTEHHPLFVEGTINVCYSFNDDGIRPLLENFKKNADECRGDPHIVTEDNVRTFLKHFEIISSYPESIELDKAIEDKIVGMGISEAFESTNYARHLNKKVIEWFDRAKAFYLTPLYAKSIFSEIRSKQFLGKLHRLGLELRPDKLDLNITKPITHIVPQGDQTMSLLKVFKCLEKEEDTTWFLSTRETGNIQKMMVEAFQSPGVKYLVIYRTGLVQGVHDLCEIIIHNLKQFEYKKVVLVSDRQDDLAELLKDYDQSMFEAVYDDVTFTDFTEASQEELLDKAVLFYEASL